MNPVGLALLRRPTGDIAREKFLYRGSGVAVILAAVSVIVNIASAKFDRSAPDLATCPDESMPEFAFIGRSNVGKSSLLNLLTGKHELARTSPTPGFTKLINFFTINRRWRLVDLPGYGYAELGRKHSSRFNQAVADYLEKRPNLCCVFSLIDSTHPPQKIDLDFVQWLTTNSVPYVIVFTKTDKSSAANVQENIAAFMAHISKWFEKPPAHYTCSSKAKLGRTELLAVIEEALVAASVPIEPPAEESAAEGFSPDVAPAVSRKVSDRGASGKRHNPHRPW